LQGLTVSSHSEFTYDEFYELKVATGRVHQALLQHDYRPNRMGTLKGTRHLTLNNGQVIERYRRDYDYDLSGNIERIRHQGDSRSWTTDVWTSAAANRSLPKRDPAGNPVTNREARFDANGNTLYLAHIAGIYWNYRNNISRSVIIDRSAAGQEDDAEYYVYGGDGIRIRKVTERLVNGQIEITEKIYLDGCEIKRIRRNGQTRLERKTSHISDGTNRIALLHQWTVDRLGNETNDINTKKIHYQITNHLGSSTVELDKNAAIINYEEYFPYGGTAFVAGNNIKEIKLKEYRYSGKERDNSTGLYYYGYRYYAPWIGNWLSPDPLGPEDSLNLYVFTQNNPVNFQDAQGLKSTKDDQEKEQNPFPYLSLFSEQLTVNWGRPLFGSRNSDGESEVQSDKPDAGESEPQHSPHAGVRESLPGGVVVESEKSPLTYEQYEEEALDANVPLDPNTGEPVFTGGAYGSEVNPFKYMPELSTLLIGGGALGVVFGYVLITTKGAGALLLLTGALMISSGIASVTVTPIVHYWGDKKDMENLSTVVGLSSGIGPLLGGLAGLLYYGDEEGLNKGILAGAVTEFALSLSYAGGRALYNASSTGKMEAALKLPEFQVSGGTSDLAGISKVSFNVKPTTNDYSLLDINLTRNDKLINEAAEGIVASLDDAVERGKMAGNLLLSPSVAKKLGADPAAYADAFARALQDVLEPGSFPWRNTNIGFRLDIIDEDIWRGTVAASIRYVPGKVKRLLPEGVLVLRGNIGLHSERILNTSAIARKIPTWYIGSGHNLCAGCATQTGILREI